MFSYYEIKYVSLFIFTYQDFFFLLIAIIIESSNLLHT